MKHPPKKAAPGLRGKLCASFGISADAGRSLETVRKPQPPKGSQRGGGKIGEAYTVGEIKKNIGKLRGNLRNIWGKIGNLGGQIRNFKDFWAPQVFYHAGPP